MKILKKIWIKKNKNYFRQVKNIFLGDLNKMDISLMMIQENDLDKVNLVKDY